MCQVIFFFSLIVITVFYFIDVSSDIYLALRYYEEQNYWWSGLTIAFVAVPWLFSIIFSLAKK